MALQSHFYGNFYLNIRMHAGMCIYTYTSRLFTLRHLHFKDGFLQSMYTLFAAKIDRFFFKSKLIPMLQCAELAMLWHCEYHLSAGIENKYLSWYLGKFCKIQL